MEKKLTVLMIKSQHFGDVRLFTDENKAIQCAVNMVHEGLDVDEVEDVDGFLDKVVKDLKEYHEYDDGPVMYHLFHRSVDEQ